jgi:hypothetical protein
MTARTLRRARYGETRLRRVTARAAGRPRPVDMPFVVRAWSAYLEGWWLDRAARWRRADLRERWRYARRNDLRDAWRQVTP